MKRTKTRDQVRRKSAAQGDNVIRLHKAADAEDSEEFIERDILAALITRTEYIEGVESFWRSDLFAVKRVRQAAKWCIDYHNKYGRAPQGDIKSWFDDRREQFDPDAQEVMEFFIRGLSDEYHDGRGINVDYLVNRTRKYFQRQAQLRYIEKYQDHVNRGELDKAAALTPPQIDFGDAPDEVITLSDVKRKPVKWLLPNLLPRGYLTLIAGVKGRGKTLLTLTWAAQLSRGTLGPRGSVGDTLVITTEDEAGDMIGPRVDVAGGDDHRIRVVQGVTARDDDGQVVVDLWDTKNVAKLRQWLDSYPETKLVIIDPVSGHIPDAKGRSSENVAIRRALAPLAKLAAELEIAIILTTHTRKGHEGTALEKIIDSTAYSALSRMVIVLGRNPDDPDNTQKGIAAVAESNLTAERLSFEYRIDSVEVDPSVGEQPMLVVGQASSITADELLSKPKKPEERILEGDIEDWVLQQLKDGWVASNDLYARGKQEEYSPNQIRSALHRVNARKKFEGFGRDGKWGWKLKKKKENKADRDPKLVESVASVQSVAADTDATDTTFLTDFAYRVLRKSVEPTPLTAIMKEFKSAGHHVDKKQVREVVNKYGRLQEDGSTLYSLSK